MKSKIPYKEFHMLDVFFFLTGPSAYQIHCKPGIQSDLAFFYLLKKKSDVPLQEDISVT